MFLGEGCKVHSRDFLVNTAVWSAQVAWLCTKMIHSSPILTENPIWESQREDLSTVGWVNAHFSFEVPLKCRHVRLDDMMRAIAEHPVDVTKGTANPVALTVFARPCSLFFLDTISRIIVV